jgi:hypothetical protein
MNYKSPERLKKEIFMLLITNIDQQSKMKWMEAFEAIDM